MYSDVCWWCSGDRRWLCTRGYNSCRRDLHWAAREQQQLHRYASLVVSDIAVFVLERDVKLRPTDQPTHLSNHLGSDGDGLRRKMSQFRILAGDKKLVTSSDGICKYLHLPLILYSSMRSFLVGLYLLRYGIAANIAPVFSSLMPVLVYMFNYGRPME